MLRVRCPCARRPRPGAGRGQEADGPARAHPAGRRGRDHAPRAHPARVRLQGRPAHRQAPPEGQHAAQRTCRCGRQRRGHRGPPLAHRAAARPALADAGAQPRVLDDPHLRAEHAPHLLPRLPARLAVVPGPGPAVPPTRELRQAQPALGQPLRRHEPVARRAARAARPARRRHRLGVLLRLRRRQAAVGLGPRAGHGHPVDQPRGAAHRPPGGGVPDRRSGARRVRDGDARGRARGRPPTAPTTRSTRSTPDCA